MGSRRLGRTIAFQTLYRYDLAQASLDELLDFSWLDERKRASRDQEALAFARLIIQGTLENLSPIDEAIKDQLEHWEFERISRIDCAILRISVYCLLYQPDIPVSVTIDEAVQLAKIFGTDDSYRFVNGVLDALVKKRKLGQY